MGMNENIKISVIVAVYNTEPFLKKCLESITEQTYHNLEIILIDDGSTDSSPAICDAYAAKDSRITVSHHENRGLSAARNEGIRMATAAYITFVDSDDYIEPDTYALVAEGIQQYTPDLLFFREKSVDLSGKTIYVHGETPTGEIQLKDSAFAQERIIGQQINGMCDKVYRADILKNVHFEEGKVHGEDFLYNITALKQVKTAVFIDKIQYSYVTNPNSVTRRKFTPEIFNQMYFKDMVAEVAAESFPDYAAICQKRAFLARLHTCRPIYKERLEQQYADRLEEINRYMKAKHSEVVLNRVESTEYWLYFHSKPLYKIFLKIVGMRKH